MERIEIRKKTECVSGRSCLVSLAEVLQMCCLLGRLMQFLETVTSLLYTRKKLLCCAPSFSSSVQVLNVGHSSIVKGAFGEDLCPGPAPRPIFQNLCKILVFKEF